MDASADLLKVNHRLESRVPEIGLLGSEGGATSSVVPTPITLDGTFEVSLTTPKELGGPGGDGANPEKLFAAGYAACFLGAMKFVASQGGPKVPSDATVTRQNDLGS